MIFIHEKLKEKIQESLISVLPITLIVMLLSVTLVEMEIGTMALFLTGAAFLTVGMGFFQMGAEMTMTPFGQRMGESMIKSKRLIMIILVFFSVGAIITISEPDLQVLAAQVASIPNHVLIWTVAIGVGFFLVAAVLRILFRYPLRRLLLIFYGFVLVLSIFSPTDFVAVAFDAGGVTTGPMTVPFIMAIGIGLSASRSDDHAAGDSFGLIALCSIGPIFMVLLLALLYHPSEAIYNAIEIAPVITSRDVIALFVHALADYTLEVIFSISPILIVFVLFQLKSATFDRHQLIKMTVGFIYTMIGLILFLSGVNVGFAPVGNLLGGSIAASAYKWLLIPIGMVIGYSIVKAEPAVHVLNQQVEEISGGTISHRMMNLCLSFGVAAAVGLSMLRVLTGINIYWILIPCYVLALLLSRFVPDIFVGVAFDSGGVASGAMTSTFLLPMAMGACMSVNGNIVRDAFGVVALVALTPLIAIQIMGCLYERKTKHIASLPLSELFDDILEFEVNDDDIS